MTKLVHNLKELAGRRKELRKRSTEAENLLWKELRNNKFGLRFRRQYSIGGYILDFYCPRRRLIVEVDGPIHKSNQEYDVIRDKYFRELDYTVLRFTNNEVTNSMETVVKEIKCYL